MELREALTQIDEIRRQMARTDVFRGYRSLTVGFTGVLALVAAAAQTTIVPRPTVDLENYLTLWVGVAVLALVAEGIELWLRATRARLSVTRRMTWLAIEQFLPAILAGALLTGVIARWPLEVAWMLPGLWAIVFSLGVFASYRLLPRAIFSVGIYYLLCGTIAIGWGQGAWALSPWWMAIAFGGGQLLTAGILYWKLERACDGSEE